MEYASVILIQLVKMFCLMFAGFFLTKTSVIKESDSSVLAKLLIYLVLPSVIINSFISNAFELHDLFYSLLLSFLSIGISIAISSLILRKNRMAVFGSSFSNVGFIGVPLITAVAGNRYVMYIAGLIALMNTAQWIYSKLYFSEDKRHNIKELLLNPMLVSFVLGLMLSILPVKMPTLVLDCVSMVAACNTPLAMIVLGIYLGNCSVKSFFTDKNAYIVSLFRLVLIPLSTVLIFLLIPIENPLIMLSILIAVSAPVGSNIAVYAQKYHKDYSFAVGVTCLSTLLSIATVPFIVQLAGNMWGL